jgi:predicted dehydrogenase
MSRKIRWGILSTANIGRKRVIPAMQQSSNGEVVAIASRSLDKAKAAAAEVGIPTAYGSYDDLIHDPNIDAIYNPLPNSEHLLWSIRCAEAGKPVLCEKPLARNAADSQQMVDAFASRNILFAEAFMYRFHPRIQKARAMVADGAIGNMQTLSAAFSFMLNEEENIRLNQSLAGGALRDVGCYCVNILRLITGEEPENVAAFATVGEKSQVDETLSAVLQFPSGILAHFDCSLRAHRAHYCDIRGTQGRILLENSFVPNADEPTTIRYWHGDTYEEIAFAPVNHYTLMAEDFADALLNQRPPRFMAIDGVQNMRVIDRLLAQVNVV